ncbi:MULTISPECIES: sugar phosphate nucleotidyltransferase [Chitinophagaceae]
MKAIIPVAGSGAKLRPHTYTQPKSLMPIAGKTILGFVIEQLQKAGIEDFVFVVGYLGEKIIHYVNTTYPHIHSEFVVQDGRRGLGDAVLQTKSLIGEEEVFIVLGDTICDFDIKSILSEKGNKLGIMKVDDPRRFGIVEMEEERIKHFVEKPAIPKSNKALVGLYKISDVADLYACLEKVSQSHKKATDEYSLTEALEEMLVNGNSFEHFKVNHWYDCGRKDSLIATNATLLSKQKSVVDHTVKQINTVIIPPVNIAAHVKLENCIIGPNVSIGSHADISQTLLKDCIIGSYTSLHEVLLDNSIIGSDAAVKGLSRSLNIGDNTEIDFG